MKFKTAKALYHLLIIMIYKELGILTFWFNKLLDCFY